MTTDPKQPQTEAEKHRSFPSALICMALMLRSWPWDCGSSWLHVIQVATVAHAQEDQRVSAGLELRRARDALYGPNKDTALARGVLLKLHEQRLDELQPVERCCVYVYLGYIEDRVGHRREAVKWFRRGAAIECQSGMKRVAEAGLRRPMTYLRHLDGSAHARSSGSRPKPRIVERIGKGYVTWGWPSEIPSPQEGLSQEERLENFDMLWQVADKYYSFFTHKAIDWNTIKSQHRPQAAVAASTREFYLVLHHLMKELKDTHSRLCNFKPSAYHYAAGVLIRRIGGRAVVIAVQQDSEAQQKGMRPGSVVLEVDGVSVAARIEAMREMLPGFSSERGFTATAYGRLLNGGEGSAVALKYLPPAGEEPVSVELTRGRVRTPRASASLPFRLTKGKHLSHGVHPSGFGYIRIPSFAGGAELADEFDQALGELRGTPGLIVDVRDNPGGTGRGQPRMVGRFLNGRTLTSIFYKKTGPGHDDFTKQESYIGPSGNWQYSRPVALLVNNGTGSAADLFACRMRAAEGVTTIGATTHGYLSGVSVYATLPCGLVARISAGCIADGEGTIIEANGSTPDVAVERSATDVIKRRDVILESAVQMLRAKTGSE